MAGLWDFVIPADCTNLFTNPSAETATTGYTANGGSIARTVGAGRKGAYGLVYTPSSSTSSGIYRELSLTSGTAYMLSVYVKAPVGVPCQLSFANSSGTLLGTATTFTGDGAWHRYSVAYTAASTATHRFYLAKNGSASTATIASDGWMLHTGAELQTYVDGDQPGCAWTSTPHASTSIRLATARAGGIIRNLDDFAMYVASVTGYGDPPTQNNITEYGSLPGALYDSSRARPRTLALALRGIGSSLSNLHARRDALIAALNPDATPLQEPFQCRYRGLGDGKERLLRAVLDGGLEGTPPEGFTESIPLRLLANDPFWYADGEAAAALGQGTFTAARIAQRGADGTWSGLGSGLSSGNLNTFGYCIAYDAVRNVYWVGGNFTSAGGVSAANIAKYDVATATWSALSTGCNDTVYALAVDLATGDVYAGGAFTSAGGVSNTARIAKWGSGAWSALSTGISGGDVNALAFDSSRNLWVGGNFTTAGGNSRTRICYWTGATFAAAGTGCNGAVQALTLGPDGRIYVGGAFTTANGVTVNRIAAWTGATFAALGSGASDTVYAITFGPDGTLYMGGLFTTANGVSCQYIAAWNGSTFFPLGSGINQVVRTIVVTPAGLVYVGGGFTAAGGLTLPDSLAVWSGSAWSLVDVDLPGTPSGFGGAQTVHGSVVTADGTVVVVYGDTTANTTAKAGTVATVTNDGTAAAYPRVIITGPTSGSSAISTLTNYTVNATISFANLTLQVGEVAILDLTPGRRSFVSNLQGNIIGKIQPGSNLGTWRLHKGANTCTFLAADATVTMVLVWPLRYRSADGGAS